MKTNYLKFFQQKSIAGRYFSVGNSTTDHFSGKLFIEGHSGDAGCNDTGLEFLSCQRGEKKGGHTHTDGIRITYIYRLARKPVQEQQNLILQTWKNKLKMLPKHSKDLIF